MDIQQTIKETEELLDTMSFNDFCKKVNESFGALTILSELYKDSNEYTNELIQTLENGR